MATESKFDASAYWEDRLAQNWGLNAVGFLGLGDGYNEALYQVKGAVFRRTVKSLRIDLGQAHILDIGSGTGFALRQWQTLGARAITGSDITSYAVTRLQQQFPAIEVRQLDIGAALPQDLAPGSFDCISALDVLYHIVDDDAYRQALQNIGQLLKPGGCFLLADNFLHGETRRGTHQVSHALQTLTGWLDAAGLHIESRTPQYVLMNYPLDAQSRALDWWWRKLLDQVQRSPRRSRLIGRMLTPVDLVLTRLVREGPTTELAVCRKNQSAADLPPAL